MLMSGRIDWEKLGTMYRPDQAQPVWTLKRLLKQEETKQMVNEENDKFLSEEGITPHFVIKNRKEILKKGLERGDLTNCNRVLDSFEDKLDMKPKEIKHIQTTQVDYRKILDTIKQEKNRKSLPEVNINKSLTD